MARQFWSGIDMMGLEILNLKLHNSAAAMSFNNISGEKEGLIAMDTMTHKVVYHDGTNVRLLASEKWVTDTLNDHTTNTTLHVTAAERSNWNAAYKALFESDGINASSVIDTWDEIKAFVAQYNNSQDLATIISGLAPKATTLAGYGITDGLSTSSINSAFFAPTEIGNDGDIPRLRVLKVGNKVSSAWMEFIPLVHKFEKTYSDDNTETRWSITEGISQCSNFIVNVYAKKSSETYWAQVTVDVMMRQGEVVIEFGTAPKGLQFKAVIVGM